MSTPTDTEEIQRIAYEIWQIEGEPAGRDREHWERAKRIFESRRLPRGEEASQTSDSERAPQPVNPGFKDVRPGMVPEMKNNPAPDLPDPPMGRFADQLQDLPNEGT